MAVVTPLNNPGGPEGDTVTVDEQLLNTEYCNGRGGSVVICDSVVPAVAGDVTRALILERSYAMSALVA